LSRFTDHWAPKRIATVNDYDVRIAKLQGEFVWHAHPDTDEFFLVVDGHLTIRLRAAGDEASVHEVDLDPGQIYVVPRGVEHCPTATDEAAILMFEPTSTLNTGDAGGERTRDPDDLD
jgi:mannose-6-phosphate isomerase-like protein (cupin superfamily)